MARDTLVASDELPFPGSGSVTAPQPSPCSMAFMTIPRKRRVLNETWTWRGRRRYAATAATRLDSCQMANTTWSCRTAGPETRVVRATRRT
jgi:hypothetical protein